MSKSFYLRFGMMAFVCPLLSACLFGGKGTGGNSTAGGTSGGNTQTKLSSPVAFAVDINQSVVSDICATVTWTLVDQSGAKTNALQDIEVAVSGFNSDAGRFFSDSGCKTVATKTTVSVGTTDAKLYMKPILAGRFEFLSSTSFYSKLQTTQVAAGAAARLTVKGPSKFPRVTCTGPFTVGFADINGNLVTAPGNRVVQLILDAPRGGVGRVYSDSTCSTVVSAVNFMQGDGQKTFWVTHAVAQGLSVTATDLLFPIEGSARAIVTSGQPVADVQFGFRYRDLVSHVYYGTTREVRVELVNVGNAPANDLAWNLRGPYVYKGGAYPGTGGTCAKNLAAETTCSVVVLRSAAASTRRSINNLTLFESLVYNGGSHPVDTNIHSAAVPNILAVRIDVGPVIVAPVVYGGVTRVRRIYTLTNVTNATVNNLMVTLPGGMIFEGGSYPGTSGDCGATLNANTTCKFSVYHAIGASNGTQIGFGSLEVDYGNAGAFESAAVLSIGAP